jgi:hypothetical protein
VPLIAADATTIRAIMTSCLMQMFPANTACGSGIPAAILKTWVRFAVLIANLAAIDKGQAHYRRFELWVKETISLCFVDDLVNAEEQIRTANQSKQFEIIFEITGSHPPWPEIAAKFRTHRLLVECKNTDAPTDSDFTKLVRDMESLDLYVAFMAYRGASREPQGKVLEHQGAVYINSNKRRVIVTLSEAFLRQCLEKKTHAKCRNNLNKLWRDHLERWLPT